MDVRALPDASLLQGMYRPLARASGDLKITLPQILSLPNAKTVQGEAPVGLAAFLGQLNDKKRRGHPFMYERLDLLKKVHDSDVKWLLATVDEKEGRELIKELIKFT